MRNITHQLSAGAVQPGDALAEEAIVQGRRTRAARDEIALLRWLGRSAHSAVALVRGGRLTMTNALFRELELRDGEWRWFVGPHGQVRYPSLRHLVCGEARELLRGEDLVRTCRFERGDRALELRLERFPTATGSAVVVLGHDVSEQARGEADRLRDRETRMHEERMHAMGVVASGPAGSTVEVRARAGRGGVVVTIADRGPGIPEEDLSRVFDPFFSSSETRETGLVLSIAYGLMERLGGSISAANRPGGGSVYSLTFPLASAQQPREQKKAHGPRRASVLLVDDESDTLEVLEELLTMEGHRVETAASGKAAIERFQRGERYDLVLCDVGMPQMSGWQVVREIRRLEPSARIWLLTGWANEISEHDPRLADVQGVLGKPLDLDELRSLLGDPQGPTPSEHHAMA